MEEPRLLEDRIESARLLNISLRKLEYMIAQGKIKTVRIGRRVLIPRKSLEAFCKK